MAGMHVLHAHAKTQAEKKMFVKLLVLATLVLPIPQLSAGDKAICFPQDAPVSEFLQAALLKQFQAEPI